MISCNRKGCKKCKANFKAVHPKMEKFMMLVNQSLIEDSCEQGGAALHKPSKGIEVSVIHINEAEETTCVPLDDAQRNYLHLARTGNDFNLLNGGIVSKEYFGPCGILQVFAARDDFDRSHVHFAYGCDPAIVMCDYNKRGPKNQFLFVACVPLRVCAACHQCLEKSAECARCKEVGVFARYCSKECQVKHWPVHKHVCGRKPEATD